MRFSATALAEVMGGLPLGNTPRHLCVALSGGLDSSVLLHALASLREAACYERLRAVHVDHGLHPDSAAWSDACGRLCAALEVPLTSSRIEVALGCGRSPEAAAREARYRALADTLAPGERLCVAHHADDQVETVLLQLLRGAGPAGLSAMPAATPFSGGVLLRPLLGFRRDALATYARDHRLSWLEDPSNQDLQLRRNYLRLVILPKLYEHWPGAAGSVSRSARLCAEAQGLLADLGAADLAATGPDRSLDAAATAAFSEPRQRNLIRVWLAGRGICAPDSRRMDSIVTTVVPARTDRCPEVRWDGGAVRKYRGRLYALDAAQLAVLETAPTASRWHLPAPLELGAGLGRLEIETAPGAGLDPARLGGVPIEVRFRRGGERLRPAGAAHHRPLKKLLQEAGIPPWWRGRLPLLFAREKLIAVADLWTDHELATAPGQTGWRIRWRGRPDMG